MAKLISFARPFLLQPLSLGRPNPLYQRGRFFLSFGDAFLFLLSHFQLKGKKTLALVPDFYCPDALEVIVEHFQVCFYKINPDFSIDEASYFSQLEKFKPRLVINYSFTGFNLSFEQKERLAGLVNEQTIIVEDFAHRFIDFSSWQPLTKNHFIIDSVRKNSPFLGGHLIGGAINRVQAESYNGYKFRCHFWQLVKGVLAGLAVMFNSSRLYDLRDRLFFIQDEVIGNYSRSTKGSLLSFYGYNLLNIPKIKKHYHELALSYQANFKKLASPLIKILEDHQVAGSELAYYPLFVDRSIQDGLIEHLKKRNIYLERLWEPTDEFGGHMDFSFYNSFLILPLTCLIKKDDTVRVFKEIDYYLKYETN